MEGYVNFPEALQAWYEKVLKSFNSSGMIDTYSMISDIDKIIAEGFGHEPVLPENR